MNFGLNGHEKLFRQEKEALLLLIVSALQTDTEQVRNHGDSN